MKLAMLECANALVEQTTDGILIQHTCFGEGLELGINRGSGFCHLLAMGLDLVKVSCLGLLGVKRLALPVNIWLKGPCPPGISSCSQ